MYKRYTHIIPVCVCVIYSLSYQELNIACDTWWFQQLRNILCLSCHIFPSVYFIKYNFMVYINVLFLATAFLITNYKWLIYSTNHTVSGTHQTKVVLNGRTCMSYICTMCKLKKQHYFFANLSRISLQFIFGNLKLTFTRL